MIPNTFCSETLPLVLMVALFPVPKLGGARVAASGEHAHKGFRKYGVYNVVRFIECLEVRVPLVEDMILLCSDDGH